MEICAVDPHVHLYSEFDIDFAVRSSWDNLQGLGKQSLRGQCWCLASPPGTRGLESLKAQIHQQSSRVTVRERQDANGITVGVVQDAEGTIVIVPGTQAISAEGLEVLSLGAELPHGAPKALNDLIDEVESAGGLAVVPWGAGKWLGPRGTLVSKLEERSSIGDGLFFADNGNRPWWWPYPRLLKHAVSKGMTVLSGSDPLPVTGDEARIASAGILCPVTSLAAPWQDIRQSLLLEALGGEAIFGKPMSNFRFWKNQINLRLRAKSS